ncbi:U-box domain-containing protein 35 [Beta vulgaris subsp. vulgaris]|uniref:U-box domain-containing protein 35 n=1 Tax=Beta vulgaris subsp. vulgaris TaxID=3555 RepID=UPI0025472B35|nr:U-box domain-containing protein 35 [Beta vulgaris subsp. vulgaris]
MAVPEPIELGHNSVAVAIDKGKNSQQAVQWTVDHFLKGSKDTTVVLVHVKTHNFQSQMDYSPAGSAPSESEVKQLFLPYRGYCGRKGIDAYEVVLHDIDVASALIGYIEKFSIGNIVVGASNHNAFTRRFKQQDVPTSLEKSAPEFCTVYVIYKGKVQTMRSSNICHMPSPSSRTNLSSKSSRSYSSSNTKSSYSSGGSDTKSTTSSHSSSRSRGRGQPITPYKNPSRFQGMGQPPTRPFSNTSFDNTPRVKDFCNVCRNYSREGNGMSNEYHEQRPRTSTSSQSFGSDEVDEDMKQLKLEIKQTMDLYKSVCDQATAAKQQADRFQGGEEDNIDNMKRAREAMMTVAELERQKCQAAMYAAQLTERLVEMESKKRKLAEDRAASREEERHRASQATHRVYNFNEIEAATNNFSESLKIGEGGYGPVYRAMLQHTPVAIKVLRADASQGLKQFQQEIEVLGRIRHPNMVLLVGACPQYGCLVYEYMENGSLEDRLFRKDNTPPIPWKTRFKIAAEIASALLFLHQAKPEPMVHRDLKPANILLDGNYTSKIADVGLARLVPPAVANQITQYHMTAAAGTFCYIDPEYQQTGKLGTKSDVYSLGIMLLQIITARPPMALSYHVEEAIDEGTFDEMLDPTITDWPAQEALALAKLALKCSELRKKDRPDLDSDVLPELIRLRDFGVNS